MQSEVLYIPYATSYHEQTGVIITFAKFEQGNSLENECIAEKDESIFSSIEESSIDDDSDDVSISTINIEDMRGGIQIHPDINTTYARFKIRDRIKQTKIEWKG